jgi:hypothetical protein
MNTKITLYSFFALFIFSVKASAQTGINPITTAPQTKAAVTITPADSLKNYNARNLYSTPAPEAKAIRNSKSTTGVSGTPKK